MGFKIVPVDTVLLTDMFSTGYQMPPRNCKQVRCVAGLPDGVAMVDAKMSDCGRRVLFKFHHPDWPTDDGGVIDWTLPTYEAVALPPEEMAFGPLVAKPMGEKELAEFKRATLFDRGTRMMVVDSDPSPTIVQG